MIARLWSPGPRSQSGAYLNHFSAGVLPALRQFPGYAGSTVMTARFRAAWKISSPPSGGPASIDAFAGPDCGNCRRRPRSRRLLTEYDRRVRHYEIASTASFSFA